jgi:hypothetical protein
MEAAADDAVFSCAQRVQRARQKARKNAGSQALVWRMTAEARWVGCNRGWGLCRARVGRSAMRSQMSRREGGSSEGADTAGGRVQLSIRTVS